MKSSVISEDKVGSWEDQGPPICFNNREIRKMLTVARAGPNDVFYDLGSGWGQNLIIALSEFNVKKAVGIEDDRERCDTSVKRLRKWKIPAERWTIVPQRFEKVLSGKAPQASLEEATIVFYGLSTEISILKDLSRRMMSGGRLVYYYGCLFPEIMPVREDYPFLVSVSPFRRPPSELSWLRAVVQKNRSSLHSSKKLDTSELWSELKHDYDVSRYGDPVAQYRARIRNSLATRTRVFFG